MKICGHKLFPGLNILGPRFHGDHKPFITVTPAQAGGKRPEGDSG